MRETGVCVCVCVCVSIRLLRPEQTTQGQRKALERKTGKTNIRTIEDDKKKITKEGCFTDRC